MLAAYVGGTELAKSHPPVSIEPTNRRGSAAFRCRRRVFSSLAMLAAFGRIHGISGTRLLVFTRKARWSTVGRLVPVFSMTFASCAAPSTHFEPLSPAVLRAEELKQQRLVVDWQVRQLRRIENVSHGLLAAAAVNCPRTAAARPGLLFLTAHDFGTPLTEAARLNGYSDTLTIANVASGSAAEKAGLKLGDRVVSLYGVPAPSGRDAREEAAHLIAKRVTTDGVALDVVRSEEPVGGSASLTRRSFAYAPEQACPYGIALLRDDAVNAFSDGTNVYVTSAMLRFVENDDQLATVIAHEIAHNAMNHSQGKQRNATLGALLGAIIDIGAASRGVRTGGEFTRTGAAAGANAFSQDFEREADYVGAYIRTAAGRPVASTPDIWRRLAQESPRSIVFAGTHPTTAERFVRLEATVSEIERKLARGEPLNRERRAPAPVFADNTATRARSAGSRDVAVPATSAKPSTASSLVAAIATPQDSGRALIPAAAPTAATGATRRTQVVRQRRASTPDAPTSMPIDPASRSVEWNFGPPVARGGMSVDEVAAKARRSYEEGVQAREIGWGERARDYFYEATQLDGSIAVYQAALGELLMRQGYRAEAQAVLSAATLLEPENPAYRRLLGESRK